jgi:hypothetical protein
MDKKIIQKDGKYFTETEKHQIIQELLQYQLTKQEIYDKFICQSLIFIFENHISHIIKYMPSKLNLKDKSETGKLIKVAPFRKEIRKTEPHKHNSYFEIIYLSKGTGTHSIDYNKYKVQPPIIFFVRKEQVHHWDIKSIPDGYVLILKKGFIDKSLDSELKALLTKLSSLSSLQVKETGTINQLFQLLTKENDTANENSLFYKQSKGLC